MMKRASERKDRLMWSFYGPKLYRILKQGNTEGRDYVPGFVESFPDKVITTFNAAYGISLWTSPIIGGILYRKGYFSHDGLMSLLRLSVSFAFVYIVAYLVRGIGRISNADYRQFLDALIEARNRPSEGTKKMLSHYDFEFWAWPVDFRWDEGSSRSSRRNAPPSTKRAQAIERSSLPCRILGYLAVVSFGRRMVYPGATSLMNSLVGNMLLSGRAALLEEKNGKRAKVLTEDGNEIDTMFVDRRQNSTRGATLVITFEGNAGFYEMGCGGTPLEMDYSVLGWNHPGFAGSSGVPYPDQEQNAVDAVMQYAIVKLGFRPEDIALFAWSIGGYTASWAARQYPDVKFVVLDATFDDIVPLAITKMPASWKNLVAHSLRTHMNLNVAEQLIDYNGPVRLIRRSRDEIISTVTPANAHPEIASNRGNFLLIKLLKHRYPSIVEDTTVPMLEEFLALDGARQASILQRYNVSPTECSSVFSQHVAEHGRHFPMNIDVGGDIALKARLALFLASAHMEDFDSTHCSPLPGRYFRMPWVPGTSPDA